MNTLLPDRPFVSVAVIVTKGADILIGEDRRKGENIYGVPGGHLEAGETLKDCAVREVNEESGIVCRDLNLVSVYDFYREDKQRHYVVIGFAAEYVGGEPTNLPEEGRLDWRWIPPQRALELNLFAPDRVLISRYLSGTVFD